jgi:hypothetical protein
MRGILVTSIACVTMVCAAGCSCSASTGVEGGICEGPMPPAGCGQPCGTDGAEPCPSGTYCGAGGECTADCGAGIANACRGTQYCDEDGRCQNRDVDATGVCARIQVQATPVTPRVIVIVDQSGSMTASFGGSNRWDALKQSLIGRPDGLIFALQNTVEFGLAMYSARSGGDGGPPIGECPMITDVPPAPMNYAAIDAVYRPADVIEDTPTGDAIDAVLDRILGVPDPDDDPTIFIVATDGEPDRCEELDPQNGQAEAIAAVERAFGEGIRTYMISVGEGVVSAAHMTDMANAGVGNGPGDPDAPYWVAGDDRGLRDALSTIVGGVLSCDLTLEGTLTIEDACLGTVRLNGRDLPCDDPNGWRAIDETHIQLQGDACDELTADGGSTLTAEFPCDVVII